MRGPLGFVFVQVLNMMTKKAIPEHCPITEEGLQYYLDSMPTVSSRRVVDLVTETILESRFATECEREFW